MNLEKKSQGMLMLRFWPLVVVSLLCIHTIIGIGTINSLSPTYDESLNLTAGYSYWKTADYRLNAVYHPPLANMWAALPLLVYNPKLNIKHSYWNKIRPYQFAFSDLFLHKNRIGAETMLNSGRKMILIFSLLLGIAIFFLAKNLFGVESGIIALVLWCFAPFFIAHGTLVTTDMALTLFYFSTIYFLRLWLNDKNSIGAASETNKNTGSVLHGYSEIRFTIPLGISLGLALTSKYSAIILLPISGVIVLYYLKTSMLGYKKLKKCLLWSAGLVLIIIALLYQFNSLTINYGLGVKKVLMGISTGWSTFLMGQYSNTGWKYYFPIVFLLKTPIPLLILTIYALFFKQLRTRENILFLLWPALLYFTVSCFSKMQIGQRHILPIYPFLIVFVSGVFPYIKHVIPKIAVAVLLLWYSAGTIRAHPWHLSYFNELIGSSDNGYKYLTDSNLDWGQGLKALGTYLKKEEITGIYLSYFGTGDPHQYGIKYHPVAFFDSISKPWARGHRDGDKIDFASQKRILLAVSATNLQSTYYVDKNIFSWLGNIPPEKVIANSIFVYDLTNRPAHRRILKELLRSLE